MSNNAPLTLPVPTSMPIKYSWFAIQPWLKIQQYFFVSENNHEPTHIRRYNRLLLKTLSSFDFRLRYVTNVICNKKKIQTFVKAINSLRSTRSNFHPRCNRKTYTRVNFRCRSTVYFFQPLVEKITSMYSYLETSFTIPTALSN